MGVIRRVLALAFVVLVVTAAPAAADPAKPGDYRSVVTRVDPPTNVVAVKVVGGDGFLDVKVQRGHDVIVKGYDGEDWLHIKPDGTVDENQQSPATYLNANRFAQVTVPAGVDAKAPPQYKTIATGGDYAWHDHLIHWMSPTNPPNASRGDVIYPDWQVQLTVDGTPTIVHGQLTWVRSVSPIPYIVVAIAIAAALIVLGRKSSAIAALAMLVAAIVALFVGWRAWTSIPSTAGPNPLEVALPVVALVAAAAAVAFIRHPLSVVGLLAAVSALGGWCIERFTVLLHPVLPTQLSFGVDRTATAAALGACVGAAVIAVRAGVVLPKLPKLKFDDEPNETEPAAQPT